MDLEKYLRDNYKTVEQLDGGGYYCEDSHHNALYIPADYDGDMKMLSYLPGDGGYPDGRMLRELPRDIIFSCIPLSTGQSSSDSAVLSSPSTPSM